ncbi:MAG: AmmeMemoRadiSam system radical SAM enzyme [Desulfobacteraceae bacterium]|nr:AmmeMemoRadiSam system radical SAM enzyme [Desulfobacteraceae bacterium]
MRDYGNRESLHGPHLSKREFLKVCGKGLCALSAIHFFGLPGALRAQMAKKGLIKTKLSPYFTGLGGGKIQCDLCPRRCILPEGKRGFCRVRENRQGKCYSLVYGVPCAIHLEPIEKKPFFHVLPGTKSLSIATAGCNFDCKFCQNWEIALASPEDVYNYQVSPEKAVMRAKDMKAHSIAYSYVEPTIFYEYMLDMSRAAKNAGLLNVMHSNGFINEVPLRNLCKVLDAAQIDLKGFTEAFYRKLCGGELAPVLETLKTLRQENVHLEITNLVIPTKNDDMSLIREMCLWVKKALGTDTPVHFSRFYPLHKLRRLPPTPIATLENAREVALSSGLEYVYIGNIPSHEAWNTFCPRCKKIVIQRMGYMIEAIRLKGGKCQYCGRPIPGIWEKVGSLEEGLNRPGAGRIIS